MKNLFKALALVLALTMAFGVTAFADTGDAPASIDITVGEIYSLEQLVTALGGAYKTPIGNTNVYKVTCTGAVRCSNEIYGASVGRGSVEIDFHEGPNLSYSNFNVIAASHPIVKTMTVPSEGEFTLDQPLAGLGYTPEEIARCAYWDNCGINGLVGHVKILYRWNSGVFHTNDNGSGESQILLNMKDGQIILFNVTIKDSLIQQIDRRFPGLVKDGLLRKVLVFLCTPADRFLDWLSRLIYPTHQVTPVLTF